jgi:hypothetical protein
MSQSTKSRARTTGKKATSASRAPAKKGKKAKVVLTAKTANKHVLYEASVQDTSVDIRFIQRIFKKERSRSPVSLREDFCGTGRLCADWVRTDAARTAIGLDLHAPTMAWGERNHLSELTDAQRERVSLIERDVLTGMDGKVDAAVAFNFSYCCFLTRETMLTYMRTAKKTLNDDGIFFLDIHGGTEVFEAMEESTRHPGFTYVWDQRPYDAITGHAKRHIHFKFPDGSQMRPAFSYDWRLWNLPELRDIILEAGFSRVDVYWEGNDGQGCGNGQFRRKANAENELSWIAYIVALV